MLKWDIEHNEHYGMRKIRITLNWERPKVEGDNLSVWERYEHIASCRMFAFPLRTLAKRMERRKLRLLKIADVILAARGFPK